ncbi:MAG TPA: DEAD/DEAH box helicase [Nocardioides sp.]|nr:DEAD/DEAH box helicase [Nocardioides sp.]
MSPYAVPVTGPARVRAADPPRDSSVEFSDGVTTVSLPVREALPVLARARRGGRPHPTVAVLAEAGILALRLVGAGRFEPGDGRWLPSALDPDEDERVRRLATEASSDAWPPSAAESAVRDLVAAVVDALPRGTPGASTPGFRRRLDAELGRPRPLGASGAGLPALVTVSLRVEADEEELVAGSVRLVLQVHDELDPLHLCDAALLWTGGAEDHGFGDRARTHAAIALRAAAHAWPVLDRLLELRVPDEITLDTDELVSLLDDGVAALRRVGVDVLWPRSLGRDLTTRAALEHRDERAQEGPLMTGLFGPDAMFAFKWQVALHGEPLNDAEMRQLASAASPVLKLRGAWTVVDPQVARKAKKRLIRTITPVQAVAAALTGTVEVEEGEAEVVVGASLLKVRERLLGAATRHPLDAPAALRATLRDYQRHGLTWLDQLTTLGLGCCLADDMGLGKTITVIALHLHRLEDAPGGHTGEARPTLVVCPASLLGNWEAEIERFAPGTPVRRFHGGRRSLADLEDALPGTDPGFVLTTYGTLRSDHGTRDASGPRLRDVTWGLVVADEAQHVKNAASAAARALRAIPGTARVALTGTPVENNLSELWAILDWAIPGLLGSRNAFRKVWAAPIESGVHEEKTRQFADLVGPFVLRRKKSDPGIAPELPPKTETDHPLGLTREQVVLYEAFVRDTMERIERADEETRRGLVLALLTGLKQICNHPAQFLKQSGAVRLTGRSHKLDLLDELLTTILAEGGAALVFTQYVAMARLLEAHLDRVGIGHQFLHGGTPVRGRDAMVRSFQAGEVPVFLLSLKAGGTGLNLTRADHVIHVDRWWNPAVEDQATDRAYRIGQDKPVQVHRMVTRGTIEERIAELLTRKRALADAVLSRGETALTELDDDELRDLVTLRARADD